MQHAKCNMRHALATSPEDDALDRNDARLHRATSGRGPSTHRWRCRMIGGWRLRVGAEPGPAAPRAAPRGLGANPAAARARAELGEVERGEGALAEEEQPWTCDEA